MSSASSSNNLWIMLIIRFILAIIFIGSSTIYIFNSSILIAFLDEIAGNSFLIGGIFRILKREIVFVLFFQVFIILIEIYLGWSLLVGFLIRLSGLIGSIFCGTVFLVQLQIENSTNIFLPLILFFLLLSLVLFNSSKFSLAEGLIPSSLQKFQTKPN
ncbi:MAG: hypothetical protein HeimC3_10950 [Candidatus Heimdallarchaeota archaeon LC_3]|nr:MAG: hypothetical protein HeimC3_10950 [Candidatus Heimdallarchaeota archaeon LC_3]